MRRVAGQRAGGRRLSESARAGLRGIREAGEQSLALCLPRSPPRCMLRVLCWAAFGGKGCCWCCKGCELSAPFRVRAGARGWRVCCMVAGAWDGAACQVGPKELVNDAAAGEERAECHKAAQRELHARARLHHARRRQHGAGSDGDPRYMGKYVIAWVWSGRMRSFHLLF